jgi:hypothetical protein
MSEEATPHFRLLSMEAFRELSVVERAEYLRRAMEHKQLLDAQIRAAAEARLNPPGNPPKAK